MLGKKTGGRKKGTPNKANRAFREILEEGLGKTIPERLLELIQANPDHETETLLQLLPYCYCKLAPVLIPPPPSAEEQALRERQLGFLSKGLDDDPNPKPAS